MSMTPDSADRRTRPLVPVILIGIYVLARIFILVRSKPFIAFDTTSYAPTSPVEVLSFTGHAPRPWGVPLLFSIMPTNEARVIADWFIGTAAWACLAWALWTMVRSQIARIIGIVAVLLLALTPQLVVWDFAVLSESLSISLGVLALGLLMIWARTRSRIALAGMAAVAFWWTFTRQDVMTMVGVLIAVLVLYMWRNRSVRKAAVAAAAVLMLGIGWHAALLPTIDKAFAGWWLDGYNLTDGTFLYRLRLMVLKDPQMRTAYWNEFGMPRCAPAEQVAKATAWRIRDFSSAVRECPELEAWITQNASSIGYKYAAKHPRHFAAATLKVAPETLAGSLEGQYQTKVQQVMPWSAGRAFWPDKAQVLPAAAVIAALTLAFGVAFRILRRRAWLYTAGSALVLVSLANTVATSLLAAGEWARFGIQEAVSLRIGLLLLVVATIDGLVMRRVESAPAVAALDEPPGSAPVAAPEPEPVA